MFDPFVVIAVSLVIIAICVVCLSLLVLVRIVVGVFDIVPQLPESIMRRILGERKQVEGTTHKTRGSQRLPVQRYTKP